MSIRVIQWATGTVGISLVNSLKTFDIIWIMTQGGPYRSSETLAVTMYRQTFVIFEHARALGTHRAASGERHAA